MAIKNYTFLIITAIVIIVILMEFAHKVAIEKVKDKLEGNPNHWKWGIFYFNPEDPRVIIPKRIPWMGWTLNMARPASLIFVAAIILIMVMSKLHSH
ncbi:MAG TPA: DUF5808 domain-containing protein [Bacteroidota bacterium]|nr:DUF5808 domain-containing protein [Bacteroidota bacterium]